MKSKWIAQDRYMLRLISAQAKIWAHSSRAAVLYI
jgi:hypothetical protein